MKSQTRLLTSHWCFKSTLFLAIRICLYLPLSAPSKFTALPKGYGFILTDFDDTLNMEKGVTCLKTLHALASTGVNWLKVIPALTGPALRGLVF